MYTVYVLKQKNKYKEKNNKGIVFVFISCAWGGEEGKGRKGLNGKYVCDKYVVGISKTRQENLIHQVNISLIFLILFVE